jgi:hypothetical protein
MRRLSDGLAACSSGWQACAGSLEVRQYYVPGWDHTTQTDADVADVWPSFSRVNHAKYIVSDSRVNIGTSNWEWGYFHQTAGASYNTNDSALVSGAQAVFDADWESKYAVPLNYDEYYAQVSNGQLRAWLLGQAGGKRFSRAELSTMCSAKSLTTSGTSEELAARLAADAFPVASTP